VAIVGLCGSGREDPFAGLALKFADLQIDSSYPKVAFADKGRA